MADRINFDKKINDSVQIGDELYYYIVTYLDGNSANNTPNNISMSSENLVGVITSIGEKYIDVATGSAPTGFAVAVTNGFAFFTFRKPEHNGWTNISSLKGYHAEVEFTNDSHEKQELFAVGSEITISSK